jgi:predicted phosphodiesterase
MKISIVSDIHGNLEAFTRVLADIERNATDTIISLGDNIGYGPDSEQVMALIRSLKIPTVMGNHELGLIDPGFFVTWFNHLAYESLQKTIHTLSPASLHSIPELPNTLIAHGCRFVHGFPPDQVATYLFEASDQEIKAAFEKFNERLCFIGHTHKLVLIGFNGDRLTRENMRRGKIPLDPQQRYIVCVGSVGQPRDRTNHAKYVIWDDETGCLNVRYVSYDYVSVANRIIKAGLPQAHADSLY